MKRCFEFFTLLVDVSREDGTVEGRWPMSAFPDENETAKKLLNDLLKKYDLNLENVLSSADGLFKREGFWPWAIVLLKKEFRLAGHVASVRQKKSEITFSSYSIRIANYSVEELGVPPVSIIYIQSKEALERAAKQSELFKAVWKQLDDRPEGRQWICIADSPPAKWIKETSQNDDELFIKLFREDKARSRNQEIGDMHIGGQIEKCIARRYTEEHPLKKQGQGMSDFAYIYHITRDQTPQFIKKYFIDSIEKLLATVIFRFKPA